MFQTEINHFFQSLEFPGLTLFMRFITALGYTEFFMVFLLVFLLGIHYKKAFILFLVLMWTAAFTFIAKIYFELPRPFHVDNTLPLLDGQLPDENTFTFSKGGAPSFWTPLPEKVVAKTRQAEHLEYGFPSGHTSIAIALWGTLLCLYKEKWVRAICVALMVLIPISRIYLGVHFLADVVGGTILGGILWYLTYLLILKKERLQPFLAQQYFPLGANATTMFLLLAPIVFIFLLPSRVYILPAFMLGLGLGFLLVGQKGVPINEGNFGIRLARTLLGAVLFAGISYLLKQLATVIGIDNTVLGDFLQNMLSGIVLIWVGTEVGVRLGWFKRERMV